MANSTKISEYSTTAANNTSIDSIDIDENCAASGINNAIRSVLKHQADAFTQGTPIALDQTNNRLGVGTVSPSSTLNVSSGAANTNTTFESSDATVLNRYKDSGGSAQISSTSGDLKIATGGDTSFSGLANNLIVTSGGNVGIGTSPDKLFHVATTDTAKDMIKMSNGTQDFRFGLNNSSEPYLFTYSNDGIRFGTNGSEVMRLNSGGELMLNKTSVGLSAAGFSVTNTDIVRCTRSGGGALEVNRLASDGTLVAFFQDTNLEGTIEVSGSNVTLAGGHLSRFAQTTDNTRISGIVKGTVMTNLDQMAVWHHEAQPATYYEEGDELPEGVSVGDEKTPAVAAYDEENLQLNCMAVSSVEGDPNVAGVFLKYDEDDDVFTSDMLVSMTGDMVIRIAQGTTVARGDLLMSAGDGTAKPQGDDIVRSKTIAKVTSTTVSHTYDDGSYLVPCVLMAC